MSHLLLLGWDAADWKVIDPLLAKGEMPHVGRLLEQSVRGNLATIQPPLSPMVWTSIATGKRPSKHGILGFTEPTPDGLAVRPVSILGRKTKALWNILHQNGKRSIVVGWWPSHPAEPIRGAMVSDLYPLKGEQPAEAPMAPGTVSPESWARRLAELRVHPTELTGEILRMFVPAFEKVDQEKDKSLHDLASIIAETMSIHAAATDLIENEPWDLAAIYYAGIDHFCHRFMRYHAGKRMRTGQTGAALFAGIVENAYRYHDVMLGRLLALAGPDCAVMLISDHGFHSDLLLPDYIPAEAAGPAVEHRDFGIFCLRAPGVRAGERVYGASVLDITPTALHILGLPAGQDMDGQVLLNAFHDARPADRVPSWDETEGEDGRHPPDQQFDSAAAAESLKQLVALGYVAPPGEDARKAVDNCLAEAQYNLARSQAAAGRADLAAPILRGLIGRDREDARYYRWLAQCLLGLGDGEGCRKLLDEFDRACAEFAPRSAEELKRRRSEKPDKDLVDEDGRPKRREMFERRELAEKASGFVMDRLFLRCQLALSRRRTGEQNEAARGLLDRLAKAARGRPDLALFLAYGFAVLKDYERALEFTGRVRRADRDNFQAAALEARIHFNARRYAQAVDYAVESLALVYFQPAVHHVLGLALRRLGEKEKAEHALRVALSQAPGFAPAREALGHLLRADPARIGEASLELARAAEMRREVKERRQAERASPPAGLPPPDSGRPGGLPHFDRSDVAPPADRSQVVTVVAGLPRSGTSMMMQMLAAAGLPVYADEKRAADEDNPRGYFEHEQAARLHQDASWIPQARGQAVKIVAHLLRFLPPPERYRLVFMHRNLKEVVASQRAMLERLGRKGAALDDARLMRAFTQQLMQVQNWLRRRPEIPVLAVNYADALEDPAATAARLARFLGQPFDECAAAAAIDATLRRQKSVP